MRLVLVLLSSLALVAAPAFGRVGAPQGRRQKGPERLPAPRLWQDHGGTFALERPSSERWAFRANLRGPDGEAVPLMAVSQDSGAQFVVQLAEGVQDLRRLAGFLAQNLSSDGRVRVEEPQRVPARGGEGYGFWFTVADEVRGRVAVVRSGSKVALAIASWPFGSSPEVAEDVDGMIGSLGPVPGALPPGAF